MGTHCHEDGYTKGLDEAIELAVQRHDCEEAVYTKKVLSEHINTLRQRREAKRFLDPEVKAAQAARFPQRSEMVVYRAGEAAYRTAYIDAVNGNGLYVDLSVLDAGIWTPVGAVRYGPEIGQWSWDEPQMAGI